MKTIVMIRFLKFLSLLFLIRFAVAFTEKLKEEAEFVLV